jgi:hypothetical protein
MGSRRMAASSTTGLSAMREIAHQILVLAVMVDCATEFSANVGLVRSGSRSTLVPESALDQQRYISSITLRTRLLMRWMETLR